MKDRQYNDQKMKNKKQTMADKIPSRKLNI